MGKDIIQRLQQMWGRLTSQQRMLAGVGVLGTLLAFGFALKLLQNPEYKPLLVGLEPADAQSIGAQLAARKIDFELTPDGKGISVPAEQLNAARLEIASQGPLHSGRLGFELFDKSSWGQTEFDERVNFQRALEGELERTIATLQGVKSARVHLVLPTPSVFLDKERSAKASVALRMKGEPLADEQLRAIARLVSGAVDDLKPQDVTILNADTNEILGSRSNSAEGHELEAELGKRLMATLGPIVGAENLRASVNVEFDLSSSEESQDKYDPTVSAVLSSQKTREQVSGDATDGGVAGTSANLPAGTAGATAQQVDTAADGSQLSSSENSVFGVNKTVRHTIVPAGRIHRLTAAILVNDLQEHVQRKGEWVVVPRKPTSAQLQQITLLARSVLGANDQRGDVITVQNMSFADGMAPEMTPSLAERVRAGIASGSTIFRYAAIVGLVVLVWALMLRPVQKQLLAATRELPAPMATPALLPQEAGTAIASAMAAPAPASETDIELALTKRNLADLIQAEPATMARTLQNWLREDGA